MQNPSIKYILKLSIPIFFANLVIPLVGIIDTGLMGNLGNLSYLSATSVAANLFSMIFWSFGFLRMGTVGLVSQAYGKKDYSEIFNIVLRNLIFVLTIFIILISLQNYIFRLSLNFIIRLLLAIYRKAQKRESEIFHQKVQIGHNVILKNF